MKDKGYNTIFFGVNQPAYDILLNIDLMYLNKSTLVTISKEKADKIGLGEYYENIVNAPTDEIFFADKYNLKSKSDLDYIKNCEPDIGLVIGWNRLIPNNILSFFKKGCFGFHGSPFELPDGRGRSPVIWSIAGGYKEYNFYLFKVSPEVDNGPIVYHKKIEISKFDNNSSLYKKISIVAKEFIQNLFQEISNNTLTFNSQKVKENIIYLRKRSIEDGQILWQKFNTEHIYNLIRALEKPYPLAHTYINGKVVKVFKGIPFEKNFFPTYKAGTVCEVFSDGGIIVKTTDGTILVFTDNTDKFKINDFFTD